MRVTQRGLLAGVATAVALTAAVIPAAADVSGDGKAPGTSAGLSKHELDLVAAAQNKGEGSVTVLVAAKAGVTRDAVKGLESLGATIRYRDDALGYVRASVPTARVGAAVALDAVQALDIDETVPLPDPRPDAVQPTQSRPAPDASTPRDNPYLPIGETGAAAFTAAHPTWDGRGVTIGVVDLGVSLDHPSLLTTSTGEEKIADWVTGTDPVTDGDPTWLNMQTEVSGSTFAFGGTTYTASVAGAYRIAEFKENAPGFGTATVQSEYGRPSVAGADINRDGDTTDVFGVLWSTASDTVWVDTNQNRNFGDDSGMQEYRVDHDVNYFGTDDAATQVAERVPFVVQTEGDIKYVNIGIVSGFHGSHVSGIASGNALFGGAMSGAAPGAKIVSSRACLFVAGCTGHALLEGMIYVAKQENVDVINMSIGGLPALNDANNARCVVYDRLVDQSNVQMFLSIGNSGPGVNTAGDPGVCGKVMGMGSYLSKQTQLEDYGVDVGPQDNIHLFSSIGPREDGGFKPNALAPGAAVSTTPLWQAGSGLPYTLPPGYQLQNGTSMAAPQATGVGALLISAAKQAGVQYQPAQIRQALMSSARYLGDGRYGAAAQGVGLLDVNAAWSLLAQNPKTVDITSSVPVNTVLSGFLASAGKGAGIYDREGVTLGVPYTRAYTFTRTSGGGGLTTYNVSWQGNDGTFSSGTSITLARNAPTSFTVNVNPSAYGIHSAILRLDDPSSPGIEYQTMNTVIVPYDFTAGNNYSQTVTGTIDRFQTEHLFFRVPAGTPALKVDMTAGGTAAGLGQIRFLRWHPYGLGIDSNAVSNCYNPPQGAAGTSCNSGPAAGALSRTTSNPLAGVWEVSVDARRTSDADDAPFSITASILGASVSPNPDIVASATIGVPVARSHTLTNMFGAFTGRAVGTALGSAFRATPTITTGDVQMYDVTVDPSSTSLRATIGSPSDPGADLDLFVDNCTSGTCVQAGSNADGDSEESVTIANPAAGHWRVRVVGFAIPSGTTAYNYVDVFANPAFGTVSVTDANALRPAGSSWTVPGSVTANAAPAAGRVLLGNVQVRTDTNVLIGQGDVVVQSVTP
jgi:hypothetical protein